MKKDLVNVVITFGIIALVTTSGSFIYKKKLDQEERIATIKFYEAEVQRLENEKLAIIEQKRLLEVARQGEIKRLQQIAIRETATKKQVPVPTSAPISIPVAPITTPIPKPPVQVQAPTPTPVVKPTVTKPSRVSRAS